MTENKFLFFAILRRSYKIQLVFLSSLLLSAFIISFTEQTYFQQKRLGVENIAVSYANLIRNYVFQAISSTYPIAALVRKQNGKTEGFEELATEMLPFYPAASSLQLAPDGVVEYIIPFKGNELAIGHNLLEDPVRQAEAYLAKDSGQLTLSSPFTLIEGGGEAIAARLPIYLTQSNDKKFWGFSTVLIRFSELLREAKLDNLIDSGLAFQLISQHSMQNDSRVIAKSDHQLIANPVTVTIFVPNGIWKFNVAPIRGWSNPYTLFFEILVGLIFSLLCTFSATLVKFLRDNKQSLERLVEDRTKDLNDNLTRLELAMNEAHQGWYDLDIQTRKAEVHDAYPRLLGYDPAEFYRKFNNFDQWLKLIHPDDQGLFFNEFQNCVTGKGNKEIEYRILTKNNTWHWVRTNGVVIEKDKDDKPVRLIGIHTDINDQKRSERVLRALAETGSSANEEVFKTIVRELALSHDMPYALIAQMNPSKPDWVNTLAVWGKGEFVDNFCISLADSACANIFNDPLCYYPESVKQQFPNDTLLNDLDIYSLIGLPLKSPKNEALGILVLMGTDRFLLENQTLDLLDSLAVRASNELEKRALNEKLKLSARVFDEAHESISITDQYGYFIDVNPSFSIMTGYSRAEIIGQHVRLINTVEFESETFQQRHQILKEKGYWQGEQWNRKKNGQSYAELLTISALKDEQGRTTHYVGLSTDITQTKQQQQKLEQIAHYDALTKLPNRVLFADRFAQAVAHSNRNNTLLAVCFIDLDNFKQINDNYGHDIGDRLLISVTSRIKTIIREEDTISRQGGDEFTLLLVDIKTFSDCEKNLQRILLSLAEPHFIDNHSLEVSASIGISLYPLDNSDQDTLIRHADQAMYQAKLAGKNRYHLFNAEKDQQTIKKLNQLQRINQALQNDEFRLYFQPEINMKSGEITGVEALIRWQHPEKGLLLPIDFLPFIEGSDIEFKLGYWVINQALYQLNEWKTAGLDFSMSINISSGHLQSALFFSELEALLNDYPNIDSEKVQLEILESSALGDIQAIRKIIHSCQHNLGVQIALDDFGTGYSSLTHIRNLPANTIKIDQSFVRDLLDDPNDHAIIDGVIGLADSFHREVIAEGVESVEHGLILLTMGCENAQGFGIAHPMPAKDILNWIAKYKPIKEWVDYNQQVTTPKQKKIQFLKLITVHWMKNIEIKLSSSNLEEGHWSIPAFNKSHFGIWIQRAKSDKMFDSEWILVLQNHYLNLYQWVIKIRETKISSELSQQEIQTCREIYEKIIAMLDT